MKNKNNLAHQLQAEAQGNSPEFSEFLHQRIMQQLKSAPSRNHHWRMIATVAAIILIAISAWKFRPVEKPPQVVKQLNLPTLPAVNDVLAQSTAPLQDTLNEAGVGIDRDAQNFADFVINQFDILPHG